MAKQKLPITLDVKPIPENEIATKERVIGFSSMYYLPDPDPILRKQGKDITTYRELLIDAHISSTWEQRLSGTLESESQILQNYSSDSLTEFIKNIFDNLDVEQVINAILESRFYGFSVLEIVWEKLENYLVPKKIVQKPQEWFFFTNEGELRLKSKNNRDGEWLNPYQFIVVQNKPTYLNPYGNRIASKIFWYYVFKKGGIKYWARFIEKYGIPYAIGKVPPNTAQEIKEELLNKLDNMVQDGIAVITENQSINMITDATNSNSGNNHLTFINFLNSEISKVIVGQTLTTENQNTGSYALGQVHESQFDKIISADKRFVRNYLNQLIKLINYINFNEAENPYFDFVTDKYIDKTIAERDNILKQIGVNFKKEYFTEVYGIDEKYFEVSNSPSFPEMNFAEQTYPDQNFIDDLVEQITKDPKTVSDKFIDVIKPIINLVERSNSLNEIKDELVKVFPKMDSKQFDDYLTKVLIIAEMVGRLSKEK